MKKILPIFFLISGCSLIGFHYHIHNPKRAGKYPKATDALKTFGDQDSPHRTCYDVTHYDLDVTFPGDLLKEKKVEEDVTMDLTALTDFDTIQIDLAETMKMNTISVSDNIKSSFIRKGTTLLLAFHGEKGKKYSVYMNASGEPVEAKRPPWDGGFTRITDDLKNPWWGVSCETEGASLWWPCKDVVNDEPDSVDMYYKVPDPWVAVGNGNLVAKKSLGGCCNLNEYHWHVSYPINLYDVTFYLGKFTLLHDTYYSAVTHDTLQLNHYVLEQHYDAAKKDFAQLKDYLAFYEEMYGPYPWYRDGCKLVESPYEGMEHQTAIAYGHGFKNDPQWGFDYIILHETAHEWWGNAVTAEDLGDGWIHEGFATYTECLWVEHKFGHDSYLRYLWTDRFTIINRRPVSRPYGIRYFDYHDEDIYTKGAWILHSLRYSIDNDSVFYDVLKTYFKTYEYKHATTRDLEKVVEDKTGKDYKWFFDQYLYDRFVPELQYYAEDGELYFRWTKVVNAFPMPVKVRINGSKTDELVIHPSTSIQHVKLPAGTTTLWPDEISVLIKGVETKSLPKLWKKSQPDIFQ